MKKSFALIGMGVAMASAPAMAFEISPYAALRLTGSVVNNDMTVISDYSFGGKKHHVNTMADETHSDFAFGANAAIGAKLDLGYGALRGEFAFDWKSDATDDNDFYFKVDNPYVHNFESTTSLYDVMFNLYYDFDTGTSFVPFLTAGLGYGHIALSTTAAGISDYGAIDISNDINADNFVWGVGAGVAYELTENLAIDLMYRYTNYGSVDANGELNIIGLEKPLPVDADFDIATHEFMLGARYTF